MRPKSVLEVGLGNGFVSTFLKRAGIQVTTVDINPNLEPDICAPLNELSIHLDRAHDLVVCCEVLEHMPLEELDTNLDHLRHSGQRLFLTLPNANRSFGIGGFWFIPGFGARRLDLSFDIPLTHKLEGGPHFWEVGYSNECSVRAIKLKLERRYKNVKAGRFTLNPYHVFFECQ